GSSRRVAYVERVSSESHGRPGTTAYLAPEQIGGDVTTASSDVYAFGTVAYEMLTGRLPVDVDQKPYQQMTAKVNSTPGHASVANSHLPQHVAAALMLALSTDPKDRPATASVVCQMLSGETSLPRARAAGKRPRSQLSTAQRVAIVTAIITTIGA